MVLLTMTAWMWEESGEQGTNLHFIPLFVRGNAG